MLTATFTNPAPALNEQFAFAVAGVGNNLVLVGARYDNSGATASGSAYLYTASGALLTAIPNPTPAANDYFGEAVAGVGSNRLLVGARLDDTGAGDAGAAYLFSTNGALLTTITNPTPAVSDEFGSSVAALGTDQVLIGAPRDNIGAADAGVAYLFSITGSLLATFTNPAPATSDVFGAAIAAVGDDRVLIGAPGDDTGATNAGAAYLFSTNGVLLTTFTNPAPVMNDQFGYPVAGVGTDRVLIASPGNDFIAGGSGAAYLFSLDGRLLHTLNNPTPAINDAFGASVAAVDDRLMIGAPQDNTGAGDAGAAYVFNADGLLLATITNPTPASSDYFGNSVAFVGADQLLIGAFAEDTGASGAGTAYLFRLESIALPSLTIEAATPGDATISWTPNTPGFVLQETWSLDFPDWTDSPSGSANPVVVPAMTPSKFYRLFKP